MKKSTTATPKKRGRPYAGGRDPMVSSRIPAKTLAAVDDWAAKNDTTRSQAIARLLDIGLRARQE